MSLISLLTGIALLFYYVGQAPRLEPGVRNQVYYIVLFPSAISCGLALFGALRGYARLTAKHPGIALELGGPAVLFVLILWGGFKLVPAENTFDLTVRAHSADGAVPVVTSGRIILDLDNDRRTETFGSNGEADFKGIPEKFRGSTINVLAQVDGYDDKWMAHRITGNVLTLALNWSPVTFHGFVQDDAGRPLANVRVVSTDCDKKAVTNDTGSFTFEIRPKPDIRCHLIFTKDGYDSYSTNLAINNDMDNRFLLRKSAVKEQRD